ncbi:hypothetical protein RAYM_04936 [Riemerella anatipestifer RA-YM]|nr:hypothetical protein RAYM_04936 [Riemerella anatipestifer RA-YM]
MRKLWRGVIADSPTRAAGLSAGEGYAPVNKMVELASL